MPDKKKVENSPFDPFVKRTFPGIARATPAAISANHLSGIGLAGSAAACLFLWMSRGSAWWLLAAGGGIFLHWFCDTLDGEVARFRGPTKLGHYLDHFGDGVSVVFMGIGLFLTPGSHIEIGMVISIFFLLLSLAVTIRSEVTGVFELPTFGPTEIQILLLVGIGTQAVADFGQPLSWFDTVPLASALGLAGGLTFLDLVGIGAAAIMGLMLIADMITTIRTLD